MLRHQQIRTKALALFACSLLFLLGCTDAQTGMVKCEAKRDPQGEQWFGEYIYVRSSDGVLRRVKCGESTAVRVDES